MAKMASQKEHCIEPAAEKGKRHRHQLQDGESSTQEEVQFVMMEGL
jgi:hypothetical protein